MPRDRLQEESDRNVKSLSTRKGFRPRSPAHQQHQSMLLSKLPSETLQMIFEQVFNDKISMMFTHLGSVNQRQVTTRYHGRQCYIAEGLPFWVGQWTETWPWSVRWFHIDSQDRGCGCSANAVIALLQTCQHIYHIAQPLLWRSTRFSISSIYGYAGSLLDFDPMAYSYGKVPRQRLPVEHIRYVHLVVNSYGVHDHLVRALVLRAADLRVLNLQLTVFSEYYRRGPVVKISLFQLFCRLQGLDDFIIRGPGSSELRPLFVSKPAKFATDVEESLQSTLKQLICNGGPRRTLNAGKELDDVVARAQMLFESTYRDRIRREHPTGSSGSRPDD